MRHPWQRNPISKDGIPVSEFTRRGLRGACRMRDLDVIVVQGKTRPVGTCEILDYHDEHSFPDVMDCLIYFNEGVRHYRASDRDRGIAGFRGVLSANEGDKLSVSRARARVVV